MQLCKLSRSRMMGTQVIESAMDLINSFLFSSLQTNLITIHFQNQNTFKFIFNTWYNNKFDWIMSCVKYAIYPLKC
jgi:3-methyladenine DNA glycosylase AlkC